MYSESKVAFVVWLWHPRSAGASYAYTTFMAPLLQRYEPEVDRQLADASARAGALAAGYYARATAYAHARFMQFVASLPQQPQARGRCASLAPLCDYASSVVIARECVKCADAGARRQAGAAAAPAAGGYVPRNANEAAAMALLAAKQR